MPIEISLNIDETASLTKDGTPIGIINFHKPTDESKALGVFHDGPRYDVPSWCDDCDDREDKLDNVANLLLNLRQSKPEIANELNKILEAM